MIDGNKGKARAAGTEDWKRAQSASETGKGAGLEESGTNDTTRLSSAGRGYEKIGTEESEKQFAKQMLRVADYIDARAQVDPEFNKMVKGRISQENMEFFVMLGKSLGLESHISSAGFTHWRDLHDIDFDGNIIRVPSAGRGSETPLERDL